MDDIIPKWKLKKFDKFSTKGINKTSMTFTEFRMTIKYNKEFRDKVVKIGVKLMDTNFTIEGREEFYKELELIVNKYLKID